MCSGVLLCKIFSNIKSESIGILMNIGFMLALNDQMIQNARVYFMAFENCLISQKDWFKWI